MLITHLLFVLGLQCETNLQEIMGWESSDVFRFDLGSLLQGQTRMPNVKSAYNSLIIGLRGQYNVKPTYRKSRARILLMWSDLTFGHSFKVKRWFTGFGELSFWWIQICIGSLMRRPSSFMVTYCPSKALIIYFV